MQIGNFTIIGENCFDATNSWVKKSFEVGHEKASPNFCSYYVEDYSMLTNSNLLMVITVEKIDTAINKCLVEMIAGGGAGGLLAVTWGNEKKRVAKFYKRLNEFCHAAGFNLAKNDGQ